VEDVFDRLVWCAVLFGMGGVLVVLELFAFGFADESVNDVEPFVVPRSYTTSHFVSLQHGYFAEEGKMGASESHPTPRAEEHRKHLQSHIESGTIQRLGITRVT